MPAVSIPLSKPLSANDVSCTERQRRNHTLVTDLTVTQKKRLFKQLRENGCYAFVPEHGFVLGDFCCHYAMVTV